MGRGLGRHEMRCVGCEFREQGEAELRVEGRCVGGTTWAKGQKTVGLGPWWRLGASASCPAQPTDR